MASSAWRLTSSRARSSRLQRVAGQSCAAVRPEARARTSTRSSGGKDRRATGARGILESGQLGLEKTRPPPGHGIATTAEFGGDGSIGGLIVLSQTENNAGAEGESWWGGRRPGERLELTAEVG